MRKRGEKPVGRFVCGREGWAGGCGLDGRVIYESDGTCHGLREGFPPCSWLVLVLVLTLVRIFRFFSPPLPLTPTPAQSPLHFTLCDNSTARRAFSFCRLPGRMNLATFLRLTHERTPTPQQSLLPGLTHNSTFARRTWR